MLLCALVFGLSALVGLDFRARLLLALGLIALYVPLAGGGPSIQRAGVMGAAGVAATLAGRPASRWYALLLAAAVTLALNPRAVEDPGWQLSFAAVVAIMLLAAPIAERIRRRRLPAALAEATALTVAATIGTAPLIALHFGQTSLVSLPANVLAAPAVAPVMWLGMVAATIGQLSTAAALPFTALAAYPLAFVAWVGDVGGAPPARGDHGVARGSSRWRASASSWRSRRPRRARPRALVVARGRGRGARACPVAPARALAAARGTARHVPRHRSGRRDADPGPAHVRARRHRAAGRRRSSRACAMRACGGSTSWWSPTPRPTTTAARRRSCARCRSACCSTAATASASRCGLRMAAEARAPPRRGRGPATPARSLRAGGIELRVLSPAREAPDEHAGADPNERAIVAEARVGGFRMLLTADAESDVLADLDLEPVDVLKVSHHGSADPGLARAARTPAPAAGGDRGRRAQHLRPSGAGHGRDAAGGGRRGVPDRPRRLDPPRRARRRADGGDPCLDAGNRRALPAIDPVR